MRVLDIYLKSLSKECLTLINEFVNKDSDMRFLYDKQLRTLFEEILKNELKAPNSRLYDVAGLYFAGEKDWSDGFSLKYPDLTKKMNRLMMVFLCKNDDDFKDYLEKMGCNVDEEFRKLNISTKINQIELKKCALLLESEIEKHKNESKDVLALSEYEPIINAINDAKLGTISMPRKISINHFIFETNIQDFSTLSTCFSRFTLLLEGWEINDI